MFYTTLTRRGKAAAIAIVACVAAGAAGTAAVGAEYVIDGSHSMVVFKIGHLGVSNNYGRFNDISGTYTFDPANPGASSFDVTIRADSVDTHHADRDKHLRSPDFLNATEFPVIRLNSVSVKKKDDATLDVTAELTLHGVTKKIRFDLTHVGSAKSPFDDFRSGFETTFKISRSNYAMRHMVGPVGDEVVLMVNIEGIRQ